MKEANVLRRVKEGRKDGNVFWTSAMLSLPRGVVRIVSLLIGRGSDAWRLSAKGVRHVENGTTL